MTKSTHYTSSYASANVYDPEKMDRAGIAFHSQCTSAFWIDAIYIDQMNI
jgi:hypothetical protein